MKYPALFSPKNPLVLASQSPQRKRILEMLNIPFVIKPSTFEERIDLHLSPEKNAEMLARGKAEEVFAQNSNSWVVGVDTLVVSAQGKILGKPKDKQEAQEMFEQKSGSTETIISGICLLGPDCKLVDHEVSTVQFIRLTADDIDYLVTLKEWESKSGGIAVEGKSSAYINAIQGNFWNIVGFPIPTFMNMWKELKQHTLSS